MSKNDIDKFVQDHPELCTDLREQVSEEIEAINGGYTERFTIENPIDYEGYYYIDGKSFTTRSNEAWTYTAYSGGIIDFDKDIRAEIKTSKRYNLAVRI